MLECNQNNGSAYQLSGSLEHMPDSCVDDRGGLICKLDIESGGSIYFFS